MSLECRDPLKVSVVSENEPAFSLLVLLA